MSADRWRAQQSTDRLHLVDEDTLDTDGHGMLTAASRFNSHFVLVEDSPQPMWHVICTRCLRLLTATLRGPR